MKIDTVLENSYSIWHKCGKYGIKESIYGRNYIVAEEKNTELYDMFDNPDNLVLDALNTALIVLEGKSKKIVRDSIMKFTDKYGFLGLINVLPRTASFFEQENVYFPKNHFVKAECMKKEQYLNIFFPFNKPKGDWLYGKGKPPMPDLGEMLYLLPGYAEPYDWVVQQFKDWAYMLIASNDDRIADKRNRRKDMYLRRRTFRTFDVAMPSYIIEYNSRPELIWNFTSLWQVIDLFIKSAITDPVSTICICQKCLKVIKTELVNLYEFRDFCCKECMEMNINANI